MSGVLRATSVEATTVEATTHDSTPVKSGQIIEMLCAPCDGRTITLNDGAHTLTAVTATQAGTTTPTQVTGSDITYTPPAQASQVFYKFEYHFDVAENSGISHHILRVGSDEVYPTAKSIASNYASTNWNHFNGTLSIEWTFDLTHGTDDVNNGRFSSWTTPKLLSVYAREYNSSYEYNLHQNVWWNGTDATAPYIVHIPQLTLIAIA